jgi:hypothetical protein
MDLDQVELDAAYDQRFYAPLAARTIKRYISSSDAARARIGPPQRESYGPSEVEKLDIYRTKRSRAPIFVFIHGGAWLRGAAKDYGYPAEMFVNAGAHYVALDFIAVGAAGGDLRPMAAQVRRAITWVYKKCQELRRRFRSPLHRRAFLGRPPVRRRARHRLAEGVRSAGGRGQGRSRDERHVRSQAGAHVEAQFLCEIR